jgi:hypothetical protein
MAEVEKTIPALKKFRKWLCIRYVLLLLRVLAMQILEKERLSSAKRRHSQNTRNKHMGYTGAIYVPITGSSNHGFCYWREFTHFHSVRIWVMAYIEHWWREVLRSRMLEWLRGRKALLQLWTKLPKRTRFQVQFILDIVIFCM